MTPQARNTLEATVTDALPNGRYRVVSRGGDEIMVHVSGKMRMHVTRILPGDRVEVERSPFDPTKGRITCDAKLVADSRPG